MKEKLTHFCWILNTLDKKKYNKKKWETTLANAATLNLVTPKPLITILKNSILEANELVTNTGPPNINGTPKNRDTAPLIFSSKARKTSEKYEKNGYQKIKQNHSYNFSISWGFIWS